MPSWAGLLPMNSIFFTTKSNLFSCQSNESFTKSSLVCFAIKTSEQKSTFGYLQTYSREINLRLKRSSHLKSSFSLSIITHNLSKSKGARTAKFSQDHSFLENFVDSGHASEMKISPGRWRKPTQSFNTFANGWKNFRRSKTKQSSECFRYTCWCRCNLLLDIASCCFLCAIFSSDGE